MVALTASSFARQVELQPISLSEQPDDYFQQRRSSNKLLLVNGQRHKFLTHTWPAQQSLKPRRIVSPKVSQKQLVLSDVPTVRPSTLVLFEDAKKQAKELDDEFSRTGRLRGPLHGVPMSFKDQCMYIHGIWCIHILNVCADEIAGYDTTIGFTHWANNPSTRDAFVSWLLVVSI